MMKDEDTKKDQLINETENLCSQVAEFKAAETRPCQIENEWSSIFDSITDFISVHDKDLRIIKANKALADFFGKRPEELVGTHCYKMFHCTEKKTLDCPCGKSIKFKKPVTEELNDPNIGFPMLVSTYPIFDNNGEIVSIIHIARDITSQKRTEEELRNAVTKADEEKAKSEAIIAAIGDGISIQDTNFKILYQNQVHKNFVGDHVGEYCYMAYEKREDVCQGCPVAMSFEDGRIHMSERSVTTEEGISYYEITSSPLKDSSSKIIAGIEVVRDITERKRIEEDIKIRNWAIESSINAIVLADLDANLTYVNPSFLKLWGYESKDEIFGMHCENFWKEKEKTEEILHSLKKTGRWVGERIAFRKDGSTFNAQLSASLVIDEDGRPISIMASLVDISEQKRAKKENRKLQLQLLQAQKMESIGRLAGGIAHDFNNILSAILGYSELTLIKLPENHPVRENLYIIRDAGEKAAALIHQLLAFSRNQILELNAVKINDVVRNTIRMLSRMIGEDIILNLKTSSEWSILADTSQIEQILMNLAVNARDAMPSGGRMTIETADVELDKEYALAHEGVEPGPYVILSVSDTGAGMSRKVQERIFEPFFTTKDRGKGTGLGLATVYGIVKQHNGYIWVDSEIGEGTTFKIYLPAIKGKVDIRYSQRDETLMKGMETILIVDDELSIRKLIKNILQTLGYKLLEASSGKDALEVSDAFEGKIDILLSDVIMPDMNGCELAESVKKIRPETKVILMSGYPNESITGYRILEICNAFVQKPLKPSTLTGTLRKILDDGADNS